MGANNGIEKKHKFKLHLINTPKPIFTRRSQSVIMSTELKEVDYKYLSEQTGMSISDIKALHQKFSRGATNGELDLEAFVEFYKLLTPDPPEILKTNPRYVFDMFDKDHNGRVSFREFMIAFVLVSPGNLERKLEYTFELFDTDGNGYLDVLEIHSIALKLFNLLGRSGSKEEDAFRFAQDVVKKLDVYPRDGKVTKEEYVIGMINNPDLRLLIAPFCT